MAEAMVFLADGFEEIEALAALDILRRGGVDALSVSLNGGELVAGRSGVTVKADALFDDSRAGECEVLILPGGPGHVRYTEHADFMALLKNAFNAGKLLCAICAAPTVLGNIGLLEGKTAVCYPGMEDGLIGAAIGTDDVIKDGNLITSKGPATTFAFALKILEEIKGADVAERVKSGILL